MDIKVLGTGCPKCRKLYEDACKAALDAGIDAPVEKVEDIARIVSFDVMITPALVLDGQVKASGRVPSIAEMATWFREAAATKG